MIRYNKIETPILTKGYIPKLIFKTGPYRWDAIPQEVLDGFNYLTSINTEYQLIYLTDDDCVEFITNKYPQYLKYYNKVIPTAFKADLVRLLLLKEYGGCYGDLTQTLHVPYDEILEDCDVAVCKDINWERDKHLYNAFICAQKNHPVINETLKIYAHNVETGFEGITPLEPTSTLVLSQGFYKAEGNGLIKKTVILRHDHSISSYNISLNDETVGQTRHPDHFNLLYKQHGTIHYDELWNKGMCYNFEDRDRVKTGDFKLFDLIFQYLFDIFRYNPFSIVELTAIPRNTMEERVRHGWNSLDFAYWCDKYNSSLFIEDDDEQRIKIGKSLVPEKGRIHYTKCHNSVAFLSINNTRYFHKSTFHWDIMSEVDKNINRMESTSFILIDGINSNLDDKRVIHFLKQRHFHPVVNINNKTLFKKWK